MLDIGDILNPDRNPHILRLHAGRRLLGFGQLRVRSRSRMNHQRFRIPDIRQMAGQLHMIDEPDARPRGRP